MKKRIISVLLCIAMIGIMVVGCGKTETDETDTGTKTEESTEDLLDLGLEIESVTVATSPGYEPFEFKEGDELMGYDVDIWNEFQKRTGIEVKWEFADFSGLLGLISSGKADAVSAQMGSTPEREETYIFSDPVNYYGSVVVVAEDNDEIKSVNDLSGKKVGVGSGNAMQ